MLRLAIKPSRYLATGAMLGHLAAIGSVMSVPLPLWVKFLLGAALGASMIWRLIGDAWRIGPFSIVELQCDREGGAFFKTRNGKEQEARVLGSSFVAPYLTIVLLQPLPGRGTRALVILPDAVEAELFRQLRVWLKWRVGRGVEPEAGTGWAGRV